MATDDVRVRLDEILKRGQAGGVQQSRVIAGRALQRTAETLEIAVASGVVEVPLDAVQDIQSYGEDGHVRVLVSAPERIRPVAGLPQPVPFPRAPLGWPPPVSDPLGRLGGPALGGHMSDGTYTQYCEDTGTITYGITADATDDSWCGDNLDDWE